MDAFFAGTSGLVLPITKSNFPLAYKNHSRLSYYSRIFNSIEINSSFYKLPKPGTIANWSQDVPSNFRFTFKLSKSITHATGLEFDQQELEVFVRTVNHLGDKKGCLLAQLPPSLKVDRLDRLQHLLDELDKLVSNSNWTVAIEFRDLSWYQLPVYQLLDRYHAILVHHDKMPVDCTAFQSKSNVAYFRFHGPAGNYRGSYNDVSLKKKAIHFKGLIDQGKTVYVYFNNTMGAAIENIKVLKGFLEMTQP